MNIKMDKLEELLSLLKKKEDEKQKNTVLWVLAIIEIGRASCRERV